jgi:hypothetical protein
VAPSAVAAASSELGTRSSPASRISAVMPVPRQSSPTETATSWPNGPTSPSWNQSTANPVVTASRHTTADTTASIANGTSTMTRVTGHSSVSRRRATANASPISSCSTTTARTMTSVVATASHHDRLVSTST